jgi:uncharacterized sulfatase
MSLLVLLASLVAVTGEPERAPVSETPPSIVLAVWNGPLPADTDAAAATPALARLWNGALLPDACIPMARGRTVRAALFTGRYPHQNGSYSPSVELDLGGALPTRLAAAGYATVAAGRTALGAPERLGFDGSDPTGKSVDALRGFVEANAAKPLFVLWEPSAGKSAELAPEELDRALAGVIATLEAAGRLATTLFAVVSDEQPRGGEFLADDCKEERMRSAFLFSFEGKIPARALRGAASLLDVYPTLLDFAGIAAPPELPGTSLRPFLAGTEDALPPRALGAAFFQGGGTRRARGGAGHDLACISLREGAWKYVLFLQDVGVRVDRRADTVHVDRSAGDQLLYGLDDDPHEQHDLFPDPEQAERVARMRELALAWWRSTGGEELALPYLSPPLGAPPKEPRPNIVLVISDDQDYEHLGFLGHPLGHMPTVDALARNGIVFPVAHVPMSRCRPSQAALLSGRWPHQTQIYDNETDHLLDRRDSLPNLLKAAGYATFQGGKMWEGSARSMGFLGPEETDAKFQRFVREGQEDLFAFIDQQHETRPLFLWWAPTLPHVPHDPPERLRERFAEAEVELAGEGASDPDAFRAAERASFAMEAWLDEGLAALVAKLQSVGELDDTLFVFLNDNGWANGFPSKGTAFEKGLRTPVVFSWKKLAGGRSLPQLVSTLDVPPTLLDFAGVPVPSTYVGTSLRPLLEGKEQPGRPALYGALYRYKDRRGPSAPEKDVYALYARTERWKYVLYLKDVEDPEVYHLQTSFAEFPARTRGDRDLYDLDADPHERHDLSAEAQHAALMDELRAGALEWWTSSGGGPLELP